MKVLSILFTSLLISLGSTACAHSEVLASLRFERYGNSLTLIATLSKIPLSAALKAEADCMPEEMLKKCGDAYFQSHHTIEVNGSPVELDLASIDVQKEQVVYTYTFRVESEISSFHVHSDYLFDYTDHAVENVVFHFDEAPVYYQLFHNRRELTANFK